MLPSLLLLHAVLGVCALAGARRFGRRALLVGAIAPAVTLSWAALSARGILDGTPRTSTATWVPGLGLSIDFRVDAFSLVMVLLVSGIGLAILAYAGNYMGPDRSTVGRLAGLLVLFAGAMTGVVVADSLLTLYLCWELTSVTSYLLIGLEDETAEARAAARHALIVTVGGGLSMLAGFVLLGLEAGTFSLSGLLADPPSGTVTSVALVLVLVGAFTKSAQYPFHAWLPRAMVAPTPISGFLHSAAMVKAGIYLIARFAPAFAEVGPWRPLVVGVGLFTMLAGGLRALRPFDLKQLLAFGTISQLGFLVVLMGIGHPAVTAAGVAVLIAHALFKSALFLVVGIVDRTCGTRDIRELPELGAGWGPVRFVAIAASASMAAVPLLAGFIAKEQAYAALLDGGTGDRLVLVGIVAGSVLTVAYSARLLTAILRPDLLIAPDRPRSTSTAAPSVAFWAPAVVLGALSVILGVLPRLWSGLVDEAARALDAAASAHLLLWHGFNPALLLSAVTLGLGAALFLLREPVARLQERLAPPVDGTDVFEGILDRVVRLAGWTSRTTQAGSLPLYLGIILSLTFLVPVLALLIGGAGPIRPESFARPIHWPIAALILIGAVATTIARRRFAAVLLLGSAGYGMALLFVAQGAPDLALTQFSVETLFVVVFLLVLRRLPDRFDHEPPRRDAVLRIGASVIVGVGSVLLFLAATGSRVVEGISGEMSRLAEPIGGGRNIVNVILVDIRGFDTVGEVTVLAAAAIGVVALLAGRKRVEEP